MSMVRSTRRRGDVSPGLLVLCAIVGILVVLPIAIIVFQAFQGGTSAISDALRASSSRTCCSIPCWCRLSRRPSAP